MLNKWCNWASLIICVDKYLEFLKLRKMGIHQYSLNHIYLKINNEVNYSTSEICETFTYLEKRQGKDKGQS